MENARKWAEALRSGKYKQGRKYLNAYGRHCCLGVACDLYAQEHPEFRIVRYGPVFGYGDDGLLHIVPQEVADWLGLRDRSACFSDINGVGLSSLNDAGVSFAAIAEIIDSQPKGLFA